MKNTNSTVFTILKWIIVPVIAITVLGLQNYYNFFINMECPTCGWDVATTIFPGWIIMAFSVMIVGIFYMPIEEMWYLPPLRHPDWNGFCVDWHAMPDSNPNKEKYKDIGLAQLAERNPLSEGLMFYNCYILCALSILTYINFFSNGISLIYLSTLVLLIGGIAGASQIIHVEGLQATTKSFFTRWFTDKELAVMSIRDYYSIRRFDRPLTNKGFASVTVLIILSAIMVYGITIPLL